MKIKNISRKKGLKQGQNFFFNDFYSLMFVNKALKYKFFQLKVQNFMCLLNSIENKALKSKCIFLNFTPILKINWKQLLNK